MIKKIQKKTEELEVFWLRLSWACNNSCIFCLDHANQIGVKEKIVPLSQIKKQIKKISAKDRKKLVLSGGEPTLHPDLAEIIAFAKRQGIKRVQMITNGRMFYYSGFLKKIIQSGIDEITISFHSHLPELYEKLTGVKGSYGQALKGLQNIIKANKVLPKKIIINIDIVVNKLNLPNLKQTLEFFIKQGIYEFDLLFIMPFGRAFSNSRDLFFDYGDNWPQIKEVLKMSQDPRLHIWLNRFDPAYLDGYEYLIQDPEKLLDEINGRQGLFLQAARNKGGKLDCQSPVRCPRCYIRDFCQAFSKLIKNKTLACQDRWQRISLADFLTKPAFYANKYKDKKIIVFFPRFNEHNKLDFKKLKKIKLPLSWRVENIPHCLILPNKNRAVFSDLGCFKNKKWQLNDLGRYYIDNLFFVKPLKCRQCKFFTKCQGMNINYLKNLGFEILRPVKK